MTKPHPHLRYAWAALVGVFAATVFAAAPAHAHAVLLDSDPADGEVFAEAPTEVVLHFNEPVEPPPEPLRVFDADGERVDADDAGHGSDRSILRVSLPADLPDGGYVVAWRAISADTHPVSGSFTFVVGDPAVVDQATIAPPPDTPAGWGAAAAAGRWLTYAGTLLAVGGAVFLLFVHDRAPAERRPLTRIVGWAVAAGAAGSLVAIPLYAAVSSGAGGQALLDEQLLAGAVSSATGASALLRLAALAVLLLGVAGLGIVSWAGPLAVAGGVGALGSFLFAGHTYTAEPRALIWASNLSHTAAAAVWLGGLVLLGLVLHLRRRAGGEASGGAAMVARFSTLAAASVLVVTVGGIALGWAEIRTLSGLTGTSYGWLLLAKVGLVAAVVALGGYNRRWLVPAVRQGGQQAWQRLTRTVRVEAAVILVGVLALTAVLVNTVPARTQQALDEAAAAAEPYQETHPLGPEYQVELTVDPAVAGDNQVTVELLDEAGDPVSLEVPAELQFSLPEAEIDRISREPEPAGPGSWEHSGGELSIAGDWEIEIRVLVDEFERITTVVTVPVADAGTGVDHDHHP
ncbi:copper resistance protein CopC [Natronosporangium hydrolyticum]|uniref:Copper resistance protein CopC n=1 Tax=Natronosporangium hydrolyticum TaxID=2811111 RepID=A0A895YJB9_9ACTN|nr:copper resistance protein CopC [Natronosporangium hydrolyticum]QSB14696.1 copper resistance protein CopC [Natronosporangium hydrolyticum]